MDHMRLPTGSPSGSTFIRMEKRGLITEWDQTVWALPSCNSLCYIFFHVIMAEITFSYENHIFFFFFFAFFFFFFFFLIWKG